MEKKSEEQVQAFTASLREMLAESNPEILKKFDVRAKINSALERYGWMDEPITRINALIQSGDAAKMPGYAYWRLTYAPLMADHIRVLGCDPNILSGIAKENFIPFAGEVWTSKDILKECYYRLLAYLGSYVPDLHDLCIVQKKDFDELICGKYPFQEFDNRHGDYNILEEVNVPGDGRVLNYREWNWLKKKKEAFSRKRCFNGRNYPASGFVKNDAGEVVGIYFGDSQVEISSDPSILEDWL